MREARVFRNTAALYSLHIGQLLIPFAVTVALTRALSPERYGFVVAVQSLMTSLQAVVDFGFNTWSVRRITQALQAHRPDTAGAVTGSTILAKLALSAVCIAAAAVVQPIGGDAFRSCYVLASLAVVASSSLLPDFLFYGLEKMGVNAAAFLGMKGGAALCKLLAVTSDEKAILIPLFDLLFTVPGILYYYSRIKKERIPLSAKLPLAWEAVRGSVWYFLSDFFPTLNGTLAMSAVSFSLGDGKAAIWGLSYQLYNAVLGLYQPIRRAFYPMMVRRGDSGVRRKMLLVLVPLTALGCAMCWAFSDLAVRLLGGGTYQESAHIFRCLLPAVFLSFPSMLYGWLSLCASEQKKKMLLSTLAGTLLLSCSLAVACAAAGLTLERLAAIVFASELVTLSLRFFMVRGNDRRSRQEGDDAA